MSFLEIMNFARFSRLLSQHLFPRKQLVETASKLPVNESPCLSNGSEFGLFFDIDGVLVRGRTVLPHTREAFRLLTDKNGKFIVPSIFCTNAGNMLRRKKAEQLSHWLGVEVASEQVVMSHSPLKMFHQFRDKHVLVSGQGPTKEIAEYLGFTKVTTIEQFRSAFPMLDMVDHKRRKTAPCAFEKYFPRIEAVILFGEPIRWETNLQLLIDVLLTNGHPSHVPQHVPYPHIPLLACNMDLMWMAETSMPRFAHGCFLHCLESLYQKITGYQLKYTALVGKPSEITYHHSEHVLHVQARKMGLPGIKRMYCIGDNPDADIYGANLYNRYIQHKMEKLSRRRQHHRRRHGDHTDDAPLSSALAGSLPDCYLPDDSLSINEVDDKHLGVEECHSILVETGVYSKNKDEFHEQDDDDEKKRLLLDHIHRDFIMDPELVKPTQTTPNVLHAVNAIFEMERMQNRR